MKFSKGSKSFQEFLRSSGFSFGNPCDVWPDHTGQRAETLMPGGTKPEDAPLTNAWSTKQDEWLEKQKTRMYYLQEPGKAGKTL